MKRLALKKETLTELAADDLRAVNGGASAGTCVSCVNCVVATVRTLLYTYVCTVPTPTGPPPPTLDCL